MCRLTCFIRCKNLSKLFKITATLIPVLTITIIGLSKVFLNESLQELMFLEGGIIEYSTALIFALTAIIGFISVFKQRDNDLFFFSILTTLAAMRELDLHKAWTSDSILKSRFYISPETPIIEKAAGGAVVLILIIAAFHFLRKTPNLIRGLIKINPLSWSIGFGFGFLTIGKIIDSAARLFPPLYKVLEQDKTLSRMIEESFEMAGSLFFLMALFLLIYEIKTKEH